MLNKVMQELIAGARAAVAAQGERMAETDEALAAILMRHYARCPACQEPIDFKPEVMVHTCGSREEFLYCHAIAIEPHLGANSQCAAWYREGWDETYVTEQAKRNMVKLDAEIGIGRERIRATDAAVQEVGANALTELVNLAAKERAKKSPDDPSFLCLLGHSKSREPVVVEMFDDGSVSVAMESECPDAKDIK